MTRDELISFLETNYAPDQELLWHTAAQGDVEFYTDRRITEVQWREYLKDVAKGGDIYGDMAQAIAADFMAFTYGGYNEFYEEESK